MLKYFVKAIIIIITSLTQVHTTIAQYTHQDTLRGSIGKGRDWWNVKQYNLAIDIDIADQSIRGTNEIVFDVVKSGKNQVMQIDLQYPMEIEKVEFPRSKNSSLPFKREGNVYWIMDAGYWIRDADEWLRGRKER